MKLFFKVLPTLPPHDLNILARFLSPGCHVEHSKGMDGKEEGRGNSWNFPRSAHYFFQINESLWLEFKDGNITKEELDATLRSHQAAIDAAKSEQRGAVAK